MERIENGEIGDLLSSVGSDEDLTALRPLLPTLVQYFRAAPASSSTVAAASVLASFTATDTINDHWAVAMSALRATVTEQRQLLSLMAPSSMLALRARQHATASNGTNGDNDGGDDDGGDKWLCSVLQHLLHAERVMQLLDESQLDTASSKVIGEFHQRYLELSVELRDVPTLTNAFSDAICVLLHRLPDELPPAAAVRSLVFMGVPVAVVAAIVANFPSSLDETIQSLLSLVSPPDSTITAINNNALLPPTNAPATLTAARRSLATVAQIYVAKVASVASHRAHSVRAMLVERRVLLELTFTLTWEHCCDDVLFLNGLLGHDSTRQWVSDYLAQTAAQAGRSVVAGSPGARNATVRELCDHLRACSLSACSAPLTHRCAVLRLLCLATGLLGLRLTELETSACMKLIASASLGEATRRFIELSLCFVLICPHLSSLAKPEVINWATALLQRNPSTATAADNTHIHAEMVLLVAIHFHNKQLESIAELVRTTLSMPVQLHSASLVEMGQLFTTRVFTTRQIARYALQVPVTPQLSAHHEGFLPIHCVYQLLTGGGAKTAEQGASSSSSSSSSSSFEGIEGECLGWIMRQMVECVLPVHALMPAVMEAAAHTQYRLQQQHRRHHSLLVPFAEDQLIAMFQDVASAQPQQYSWACAVLAMFHVLCRNDRRRVTQATPTATITDEQRPQQQQQRRAVPYSSAVIDALPARALLTRAQADRDGYANIYAPLVAVAVRCFPQLFDTSELLMRDLRQQLEAQQHRQRRVLPSCAHAQSVFAQVHTQPAAVCRLLDDMQSSASDAELLTLLAPTVDVLLPALMEMGVTAPLELQRRYAVVWEKLASCAPRRLWLASCNAMRDPLLQIAPLTHETLVQSPLATLQCRLCVFRMPPLFEGILLTVLRAYLCESSAQVDATVREASGTATDLQEMSGTLVRGMEGTALLALLGVCLRSEELDGSVETSSESESALVRRFDCDVLSAIQRAVCSYAHQAFIQDPLLMKFVHDKGYDLRLVPLTVAHVPSMHVCLDWLPELFASPSATQRAFAARLAAALAVRYPLPKSLAVCHQVIACVRTLILAVGGAGTTADALRARTAALDALPALADVFRAFPMLSDDTVNVLVAARARLDAAAEPALQRAVAQTFSAIADDFVHEKRVLS